MHDATGIKMKYHGNDIITLIFLITPNKDSRPALVIKPILSPPSVDWPC